MELNVLHNMDCMEYMKSVPDEAFNITLTDIPYAEVNRESNGLRALDKEKADIMTFDMQEFLSEVYRVTKGTIIIFCGQHQLSEIKDFFQEKQNMKRGTVRQLVWKKTNPSPMNGQSIYLSGIENAIWFKKRGGVFNANCKNTVFEYPCGRSKIHPTEKNHDLIRELILDNSNEGDILFDPCAGSASHCLVAKEMNRQYVGTELNSTYYALAKERLESCL